MLFSGVFIVLLVWLGTRQVISGDLQIGQLISFLGYALFMIYPIQTFFELAQKVTRAMVSARKAIAIFEEQPPVARPAESTAAPAARATSYDELTRLRGPRRRADRSWSARCPRRPPPSPTGWAATCRPTPSRSARSSRRGSRAAPPGVPAPQRLAERARLAALDEELANREWGVRLGGVDLGAASLDDVRRQILVSDTGSQLFAGTLQDAIDPHGRLTRAQAEEAVRVANAEDVYDALPGGWQGLLDERGRGLSGGQRQRVVLARALAADAPVLVLVEPTSAVDAHTEARIAARVAERPARAHHRGQHGVAAVAAPRRPGGAASRRPGRPRRHATRTCCATARRTAASSRAPRWTHPWRRWPAMSTALSDPLATSRGDLARPVARPSRRSRPRWCRPRGVVAARAPVARCTAGTCCASSARWTPTPRRATPTRGWPVADNHVVLAFFRGLLRERKGIFFWLIVLNALAAGTALVVPRLLGQPGQPHRRRRQPGGAAEQPRPPRAG